MKKMVVKSTVCLARGKEWLEGVRHPLCWGAWKLQGLEKWGNSCNAENWGELQMESKVNASKEQPNA